MEITIGILTLLVAILTLKLQFFSKPQEELKHSQIQFKATQRLSLQVQKELEQFIFEYHVGENEIFSGLSVYSYVCCLFYNLLNMFYQYLAAHTGAS